MTSINNNVNVQAIKNNDLNQATSKLGNLNGKKVTVASAKNKITLQQIKKFFTKNITSRKAKKIATEQLQNSNEVKISQQYKDFTTTINNISNAIKLDKEYYGDENFHKLSESTLNLLEEAQELSNKGESEFNSIDSDKAKTLTKKLLSNIDTELEYNKFSLKELTDVHKAYAKSIQKHEKQLTTAYQNTLYGNSNDFLNEKIEYKNYLESKQNLYNELIKFRTLLY